MEVINVRKMKQSPSSPRWFLWQLLPVHSHNSLYNQTIQHFYMSIGDLRKNKTKNSPPCDPHGCPGRICMWMNRLGLCCHLFGRNLCSFTGDGIFNSLQLFQKFLAPGQRVTGFARTRSGTRCWTRCDQLGRWSCWAFPRWFGRWRQRTFSKKTDRVKRYNYQPSADENTWLKTGKECLRAISCIHYFHCWISLCLTTLKLDDSTHHVFCFKRDVMLIHQLL